jgi:hypothetical protein
MAATAAMPVLISWAEAAAAPAGLETSQRVQAATVAIPVVVAAVAGPGTV